LRSRLKERSGSPPRGTGCLFFVANEVGKGQTMTSERGPHAVDVIVDVQVHEEDRIFTYAVPNTLERPPAIGDRVIVPFGHRKAVEGYVVGFASAGGRTALKPLTRLLDPEPLLSEADIAVAQWMQNYYLCPLVQAL